MASASLDGSPLLRTKGVSTVDVVEEGAQNSHGFDEIDGSRVETTASRRGRRGAALSLVLIAVSAVFAVSFMRERASLASEGESLWWCSWRVVSLDVPSIVVFFDILLSRYRHAIVVILR